SEGGNTAMVIQNAASDNTLILDPEPATALQPTAPGFMQRPPGSITPDAKPGFFSGSMAWIKENPVPSLLVAVVIGGVTYYFLKGKNSKERTSPTSLNGIGKRKKGAKAARSPKVKVREVRF